jgi:ABC-type amino acid transport substrate-binding protein
MMTFGLGKTLMVSGRVKLAAGLAALLAFGLGSVAQAQGSASPVLDRIKSTGKITIAHAEDFMPFSYYDPENKPIGYSVELCRKIADAVKNRLKLKDLQIQYTLSSVTSRMDLIEQGKADLECGVTANNAERRKRVSFTVPHYITGVRYAVLAKNSATDISQLQGKRMVTVAGTTAAREVVRVNNERLLKLQVSEQKDDVAAFRMLERGETDAIALDEALLIGLIASRPNPGMFKIVGKLLTIEPLAIMMSKNDAEFKRIVDEEMKRIINSREIFTMYERWFTKPIEPNNVSMNMPLGLLLRDLWKFPSDQVPF